MIKANINRIMEDILFLEKIPHSSYPSGCTRHSYSKQDMEARKYILDQCETLGLDMLVDGVGNIRARYTGESTDIDDVKPVLIGSHIDTVTSGGAYDGVVGVMCALETIRVIKENNVVISNPIELIIFAEEEGSNFAGTLLGSKALIGNLTVDGLKEIYNDAGKSAYDVIKDAGFEPDKMPNQIINEGDIKAMIEMHIEQGDFLDSEGYEIGIVQAIAGQRTYKIQINGVSNHAGSTRMISRNDPLVGASQVISQIQKEALSYEDKTAVATVGKILAYPNSTNAIAEHVEFYADIRDVDEKGIVEISDNLERLIIEACNEHGLTYSIELLAESPVVRLDKDIIGLLSDKAKQSGANYTLTNSGAVHDSVMLAGVTKVGMLFVPSVKGLSHCPEEYTKQEDIEKGCNILIDAVIELAGGNR